MRELAASLCLVMACGFDPSAGTSIAPDAPVAESDAALLPDSAIPTSEWWDTQFSRRIPLLLRNAARSEALADFPVLVVLDPARVDYADLDPAGADIRFVDPDDTVLDHEIDQWSDGGTSYVWVRVPRIDAMSNDDFIWMYFGNSEAADAQSPDSVWNTDFVGVWHLDENPGPGGSDDILDSTSGAHHGTATSSLANDDLVTGCVGRALRFENNGEYIDAGTSAQFTLPTYTWSLWLNASEAPTTGSSNRQPIWNGDVGFNFSWDHNQTAFTQAAAHRSDSQWHSVALSGSLSGGTWYHITGSYDGSTLRIYRDGQIDNSQAVAGPLAPNGPFTIGGPVSGGQSFFGLVDEVRVSSTVRSPDWIDAEHASMTDSLITYGPVESL